MELYQVGDVEYKVFVVQKSLLVSNLVSDPRKIITRKEEEGGRLGAG